MNNNSCGNNANKPVRRGKFPLKKGNFIATTNN